MSLNFAIILLFLADFLLSKASPVNCGCLYLGKEFLNFGSKVISFFWGPFISLLFFADPLGVDLSVSSLFWVSFFLYDFTFLEDFF